MRRNRRHNADDRAGLFAGVASAYTDALGPRVSIRNDDSMEDFAQPLLDLVKAHSDWAAAIMFVTAFGESFAFISLLFPGTTVLVAAGTLLSAGTLPYA